MQRHRLSRRGNRQLNSALHGVAITQQRHPGAGRDYYAKKIADGKTTGEARRALKRHLADLVYATSLQTHSGAREDNWGRQQDPARLT